MKPSSASNRRFAGWAVKALSALFVAALWAVFLFWSEARGGSARVVAALAILSALALAGAAYCLHLLAVLRGCQRKLERSARRDELTGLLNRRHFLETCADEVARAMRYGQSPAFLELDLDFFKCLNDAYGHAAGDAVLKGCARAVVACLRDVDRCGRLGGEEFGILLPNTDAAGAQRLGERLVAAAAACEIGSGGLRLRFTVSVGATVLAAGDHGVEALLVRSGKALQAAKAAGRNCQRFVAGEAPAGGRE